MINPENINLLFQHMKWADSEIWKKILTLELVEPDVKIRKLLYHLHQIQYAFLALWQNSPVDLPKSESFKDLKSIAKWGFDYQQKLDEFLLQQKGVEKDKIIQIPWSVFVERRIGKKVAAATLQETILQVTSHSTYHRAQINTRLRELDIEPASIDFIIWVWLGKPKVDFSFK